MIYLASQMLVHRSNERGYLVGSRGSVGSSFVATMIGITEVNPLSPHYVCSQCQYSEFITDGSYGSGFDMPDKDCPNCGHKLSKNGQDIPFETFLGFDGDKGTRYRFELLWGRSAECHLDVRDIFGEEYAFRAGTVGTVAAKTPMVLSRVMSGTMASTTAMPRSSAWLLVQLGSNGRPVSTQGESLLFQTIWMSMTLLRYSIQQMM